MNKQLPCMMLLVGMASSLQAQVPVLNVNGKAGGTDVYLQALDVRVEVTGEIATTTFTMTFKNRTGRVLEGELIFPLPEGVTPSHHAIDINGKMREAVPVEKARATRVFEEIEQRQVDPGLLERVEGNNFRTRVYPIPANGSRVVAIGYEQELPLEEGALRYRLPMDYRDPIERFSLKATVWQGDERPRVEERFHDDLLFDRQGRDFVATFSRENYRPARSLAFSLPVAADRPRVWVQPAAGSYYFLASCLPAATGTREKEWSNRLGIIWDASLSGLQRDIPREIDLLDKILKQRKDITVYLYLLNNTFTSGGTFRVKNGEWQSLRATLESVTYDGGTNLGAILLENSPAREFLLFSDGLSTLGDADFTTPAPVHCIVSSPRADYSAARWIALRTKGKFINLNALSPAAAIEELIREPLQFLGVEAPATAREIYPSIPTTARGNFSVAGILDAPAAEITLLFGRGEKVEQRVKVSIQAREEARQGNIHRLWARKKIDELDLRHEQNKEELAALGRQFGIVTRNTSLIVLESVQDYLTYDITPPDELLDEYLNLQKSRESQRVAIDRNLMDNALRSASELKQWWATTFTPAGKPAYPRPDGERPPRTRNSVEVEREVTQERVMLVVERQEAGHDVADLSDHRLVASEAVTKAVTGPGSPVQPSIRLAPIKQDNDYTAALTGNAAADYATYLRLRPGYITTPSFYFDMADWFHRLGDREKAFRILTSVADLDLENASLARLLGYRLKEYGEYPLAVHAFRKVIAWRPMEPQGYRDHALALADAGREQEALDSLYSVLTRAYAPDIVQRFEGIEEVVVTEINRLLATRALDTAGIDPRLLQPMPVDIRVVLNWNMDYTDIDLHVTDPNGETCYYGHRETATGGRVSRDITRGLGPEQFMLKKAIPGKYRVNVNYFGDSRVTADGPATLMLEIYTRYSDKSQQRRVTCLQLTRRTTPDRDGTILVAEFEF